MHGLCHKVVQVVANIPLHYHPCNSSDTLFIKCKTVMLYTIILVFFRLFLYNLYAKTFLLKALNISLSLSLFHRFFLQEFFSFFCSRANEICFLHCCRLTIYMQISTMLIYTLSGLGRGGQGGVVEKKIYKLLSQHTMWE